MTRFLVIFYEIFLVIFLDDFLDALNLDTFQSCFNSAGF